MLAVKFFQNFLASKVGKVQELLRSPCFNICDSSVPEPKQGTPEEGDQPDPNPFTIHQRPMASSTSAAVILLLMLLGSVAIEQTDAINCKIYVFAQKCLGVSAKRAQMPPLPFRNLHIAGRLGPSPPRAEEPSEDQVDYDSLKTPDDFLQALFRKYWNHDSQEVEA